MKTRDTALHLDTKFTYEDYLHFPEDKRYEIIDGEVSLAPSPDRIHQDILRDLGFILWEFVKKNDLGLVYYAPFDVVLSDTDIVQPDLIFVSKERKLILTEKNIQGAPDIVVEILSPSSQHKDTVIKAKLYKKFGVREYWLIDPQEKQITLHDFSSSQRKPSTAIYTFDEIFESPLLPGLKISLKELFI
ncbi:MAG: Uma2 family endonuclease [bacterium]